MNPRASQISVLMALFSLLLGSCAPLQPVGTHYSSAKGYAGSPPGTHSAYQAPSLGSVGLPATVMGAPRSDGLAVTSGLAFRDGWVLGWGEPLEKLQGHFPDVVINCNDTPPEDACVLPADILPDAVSANDAFANFYHDGLFCVWLFYDHSEFSTLGESLAQSLGTPAAGRLGAKRWSSETVLVDLLTPQSGDGSGTLVLTYKPLMKVMMPDMHTATLTESEPAAPRRTLSP